MLWHIPLSLLQDPPMVHLNSSVSLRMFGVCTVCFGVHAQSLQPVNRRILNTSQCSRKITSFIKEWNIFYHDQLIWTLMFLLKYTKPIIHINILFQDMNTRIVNFLFQFIYGGIDILLIFHSINWIRTHTWLCWMFTSTLAWLWGNMNIILFPHGKSYFLRALSLGKIIFLGE